MKHFHYRLLDMVTLNYVYSDTDVQFEKRDSIYVRPRFNLVDG
jgi:hypothetical protein